MMHVHGCHSVDGLVRSSPPTYSWPSCLQESRRVLPRTAPPTSQPVQTVLKVLPPIGSIDPCVSGPPQSHQAVSPNAADGIAEGRGVASDTHHWGVIPAYIARVRGDVEGTDGSEKGRAAWVWLCRGREQTQPPTWVRGDKWDDGSFLGGGRGYGCGNGYAFGCRYARGREPPDMPYLMPLPLLLHLLLPHPLLPHSSEACRPLPLRPHNPHLLPPRSRKPSRSSRSSSSSVAALDGAQTRIRGLGAEGGA